MCSGRTGERNSQMISERENVFNTLEFEHKGKLPIQKWNVPWSVTRYPEEWKIIQQKFPDSIVWCQEVFSPFREGNQYKKGQYIDEWGCVFENLYDGIIGEVKNPPVQDWNDLSKIRLPKELLNIDKATINAFCKSSDKFILSGTGPRPFERLQFLRGTENLFVDIATNEAGLLEFMEQMHKFYCAEIEVWCQTNIDGLFFQDDWGTQNNMLISPEQWRMLFKPMYKDFISIAKAYGKKTFMHSDGQITSIYPDLIEIGLDAINSQIFCMDRDILKKFAGKITFWGEVDRQYLLCRGSEKEVREAAQDLKKDLYCNGGLIAQCDFGLGVTPERITWALEELTK